MLNVSEIEIMSRIRLENPWWDAPHEISQPERGMKHRAYFDLFYPLVIQRDPRRALILMGPRRVGKTVMMHQAVQKLIESGINPTALCHIDLQTPLYNGLPLEKLLTFAQRAAGFSSSSDTFYIFFDEIQYLYDWAVHLKNLVDHHPNVKFVASGSAAAALRMKSQESGAGRFTDFLLPPVTFYEFLQLIGYEAKITVIERDNGRHGVQWEEIEELNSHFVDYLNFGGYPEAIFSKEIQKDPGRFVRSDIIEKVLLRDLPSLYGINDVAELNSLFTNLAYNTANEISLDELSKKSGVAKNTIKRYIDYLESAFLIKVVHRIDRSAKRFQRANFFKVYLTNPCMRGALFSPVGADDSVMGHLVETGVFAQFFHDLGKDLYYARWPEGEVDVVTLSPATQKPVYAIEVKWSDRCHDDHNELKSFRHFLKNHKECVALVTTRTASGPRAIDAHKIIMMPACIYCYFLGWVILKKKRAGELQLSISYD